MYLSGGTLAQKSLRQGPGQEFTKAVSIFMKMKAIIGMEVSSYVMCCMQTAKEVCGVEEKFDV